MQSDYPNFKVTIENKVAHIVLNRPEKMNAMNSAFWNDLPTIVNDINNNSRARCIVISSTGKHFSAGLDLSVVSQATGDDQKVDSHIRSEGFIHHLQKMQDSFSCLESARIPVICAIQGGAIGGAVDLASACDIRLATNDGWFCIQEINIAMTADVGTFPRLCKLMPEGWVRQLAYTGERLSASRAKDLGLVNDTFDTQEAMVEHALKMAAEIATKSPLAVTGSKEMINYARDHSIADGLKYIAVWNASMLARGHMIEAITAKNEGRTAEFPDLGIIHDKAMP